MPKKQKYPLLTAEEEKRLIHKIRAGDANALDWFINCNVRMVHKIANRYRQSGLEYDDLVQEGMLGLLSAIDKFEPEQGNKFSTLAYWWINSSINRAVNIKARAIRLPGHVIKELNDFRRMYSLLESEKGREPNLGELVKFTELPSDKVQLLLVYLKKSLLSIDETIRYNNDDLSSNDTTYSEILADETSIDAAELASAREVRQKIDHVLGHLPDREAKILRHRFGLIDGQPKKLREIGVKLRISDERVRQLEAIALEQLRKEHLDILEDYRQVDLSVLNSEQGVRQMPGISQGQIEVEAKRRGLVTTRMALAELGITHSNPSAYFKQLQAAGLEAVHSYGPANLYRLEDVKQAFAKLKDTSNIKGSRVVREDEENTESSGYSGNLAVMSVSRMEKPPSANGNNDKDDSSQVADSPTANGGLIDKVIEQASAMDDDCVHDDNLYQVVQKTSATAQSSNGASSSGDVLLEKPSYNSVLIQTAIYLSGSQSFRELGDEELQEKMVKELANIEFVG